MEFPDLGANCAHSECRQLDFLPLKCQQCQKLFCKNHFKYECHGCHNLNDFQIPACPLCGVPIPCERNQPPDVFVERHILSNCKSQPARSLKGKIFSNKCSLEKCRTRETVKINCSTCHKSFCLRHRLEMDHDCGKSSQLTMSKINKNINAKTMDNSKKRQEEEDYNLALAIQQSMYDSNQPNQRSRPIVSNGSHHNEPSPSKCLIM